MKSIACLPLFIDRIFPMTVGIKEIPPIGTRLNRIADDIGRSHLSEFVSQFKKVADICPGQSRKASSREAQ